MRLSKLFRISLLAPVATLAAGQSTGDAPAAESAADKQRASVAAMADSLAKQRASIRRQIGAPESGGFFELPAPPRSGVAIANPFARVPDCDPLPEAEIDTLVNQAAKQESLQPELVRSVIRHESASYPCAVSPKGAMGLMQLMPETAAQFNVKDPFDAESNVNAGARLLKQLLTRYNGSLEKALGAYNAGTARVDEANGIPAIPETMDYVRQILSVLPAAVNSSK